MWCAQCLEYDLVAQARTITELHYELERVLVTHVVASLELGREPFAGLGPAPQQFWDMYQQAELSLSSKRLPFRVPHPAAVPLIVPDLRIAQLKAA